MLRKDAIQIRIEEELKQKANQVAKKRHTTVSEMIRSYLEREVNSTYGIQENITQECAN
jgi:antitoxin component of RelBE/YafQ-DinJ toxin-antitoxin module